MHSKVTSTQTAFRPVLVAAEPCEKATAEASSEDRLIAIEAHRNEAYATALEAARIPAASQRNTAAEVLFDSRPVSAAHSITSIV
jgi:hypothetical protein